MAWVKLDDQFPDHPKVTTAGPLASWLYVCGLAYCNRYLTDGIIPLGQVRRLADVDDALTLADRLVDAGLWERTEAGYTVHDYHKYQPAKEKVETTRQSRAEAGSRGGKQRASNLLERSLKDSSSKPLAKLNPVPGPVPVVDSLNPEVVPSTYMSDADASDASAHTEPPPAVVLDEPPTRTRPAPKPPKDTTGPAAFQAFYASYPRHEAKADALAAWQTLKPDSDLVEQIMAGVQVWRASGREVQFVPLPATFLRGRRWEDEPQPTTPATTARASSNGHKGQPAGQLRAVGRRFSDMVKSQEVPDGQRPLRGADAPALALALPREHASG